MFKKPDYLISLATASLLINVEVKVWSATRQDRSVSDEITSAKNADREAGKFIQNLLAGDPRHKKILMHRQSVYNWLKRLSYDWAGSQRLLPMARLEKTKAEYRDLETEHATLVDDFVAHYPSIVAQMAFSQGTMFDKTLYPSEQEVRNRFSMKLFIAPVPVADFRCAVAQEIIEDMNQYYSQQANEQIHEIMSTSCEQLLDYIERIAHACSEPEDGKRRPKVYESTIQGAKELIDTLATFNIIQDPKIEAIRKQARQVLANYTAEDIRDSEAVKATVKDGMDDILSKFGMKF
jgi:hypothetical protein